MIEFNPNKPGVTKQYFWATYIPGRRPEFKMYAQQNHAKSSFKYRSSGILYKWENEEWKEMFRLENYMNPNFCDSCKEPLTRYSGIRGFKKGTFEMWTLCSKCKYNNKYARRYSI